MTIASSTTNPVATVSAISVRLLIENPARYMKAKVPTSDSGTATAGISVADSVRRNRKITMTTSATASINSNWTAATDASMVVVRSDSTSRLTAPGRPSRSAGNCARIRATVSSTLAPGWRWMFRITAGSIRVRPSPSRVAAQAARNGFSAPSVTSATSDSRTGAPFRNATISARYSSAERSWSLASSVDARVGPSKPPLA